MTDEQLNALEKLCRAETAKEGRVSVRAEELLELVNELRELRRHAADLSAHEATIANLHRLVSRFRARAERSPDFGDSGSGHVVVQDPGR
jgi:hypothetical protein